MTRFALTSALLAAIVPTAIGGDWPQWRGPDRSNVSAETGLLTKWSEAGPKLLWTATGLGQSVVSVAIAGGRAFTVGYRGDNEFAVCVDIKDGTKLWETRIGRAAQELQFMRGLSQRVPTVDGECVYVTSFGAELFCLDVATGKEHWRKHYDKDFAGKPGTFWFCDQPLVDGERLVITPGGKEATIAALDKKTGAVIWRAQVPEGDARSHSTLVAAEIAGVKQYVNCLARGTVSVAAADGRFLWRYDGAANGTANTCAPIIRGNEVFLCNGYGVRCALVKISRDGEQFKVDEVYRAGRAVGPWLNTPTRLGDYVYLSDPRGLTCVEWATGKEEWTRRLGAAMQPFTIADGHIFVRDTDGKIFVVEASPAGFRKKAEFSPPRPDKTQISNAPPVVSGGRLYIRDLDSLLCYGLTGREEPVRRKKAPDAGVFVPSPVDVVEKMLELAAVKRDELVVDLGCGDGRILVAAAQKYWARGWGIDIDKECVRLARENVAAAKVRDLVTIAEGDLFEADVSKADVVALFLVPQALEKLVPKLEKLRPGARVISHGFAVPGLKPAKVVSVTSKEDEIEHKIYLYTVPLSKEK
jgi:outer membrane protein assembly factor BamB/protein-L-isoaspartate O-methyltransferase